MAEDGVDKGTLRWAAGEARVVGEASERPQQVARVRSRRVWKELVSLWRPRLRRGAHEAGRLAHMLVTERPDGSMSRGM